MANNCFYTIKILGKKDNCQEFVERLESYHKPNHFWRFFDVDVYDEESVGDLTAMYISGDCAWSLESCCRASGYSGGVDLFAVNTEELSLSLEAYSREIGMLFEEHYIYKNGACITDDCRDIDVFWWDRDEYPTYGDFKKDYPDAPPEACFADDCEVITGGFGSGYECWHI